MDTHDITIVGREDSLALAVDALDSGVSVDVVGDRGSGRTTFLAALRSRLVDDEWHVVSVHGIPPLAHHALAALHLSGVGAAGVLRAGATLHETADSLSQLVRHPKSVILIDDGDDVDETSWGVIEAVRAQSAVPVVLTRLRGRGASCPRGLDSPRGGGRSLARHPAYVIDLAPFGFEEMESAIEERLSAPIEAGTLSRIFAKSGGNIGLALRIVDTAVRERRMTLRSTEWTAQRSLWSPSLRGAVEAHLERLEHASRDALETIAIAGVADLETVRRIVDESALEELEERRLIAIVPSGDRQLVTIVPPLVVEYLRHEPMTARRARLTEAMIDRLGQGGEVATVALAARDHGWGAGEQDALFARLLQEQMRGEYIVAGAEWRTKPSAATAVRYLRAIMTASPPTAAGLVAEVLGASASDAGDASSRAEFAVLRAQWRSYIEDDLDGAIEQMRGAAPALGDHARTLEAAEVRLLVNLRAVPDDYAQRLAVSDDLPTTVRLALLETHMVALVSLGLFAQARSIHDRINALDRGGEATVPRVLLGLAQLGQGCTHEALDTLQRGFDDARSRLDVHGMRMFGAAAALANFLAGDYTAVDDLLDVIFAVGEPAPVPPGIQLSLLSIASMVAVRRGQLSVGERFAAEISARSAPDGPLPGQTGVWPRVQLLAFDGESDDAADLLWESSLELWDRGARFAGVTGMLFALEISPRPGRLRDVRARLRELPEAEGLRAHAALIAALLDDDADAMLDAADELTRRGLLGLALSACQHVDRVYAADDDDGGDVRARSRMAAIRALHPDREIDTARFGATAATLTERERQVGRLAAEGFSNQEIATRLVLSVRTIESHMHRIIRKLGVTNRRSLRRHEALMTPTAMAERSTT